METGWAGLEEEDFDEVFAMNNEEGSTPVMDPMDFGEPVNWTPLDGSEGLKRKRAEVRMPQPASGTWSPAKRGSATISNNSGISSKIGTDTPSAPIPSLKRRKDAETQGHGDSSSYVTINWHWEMTHPDDYSPDEWSINDQIEQAVREGESGWYSFEDDEGHSVEAFIYDPSFGAEGINYAAESSFMTPDLLWENLGGWWKAVGINPDYDMGQSQGQQQTGGGAGAAAGSGEGGESEGQAQQEQEQEQEGHRGHGDSSQPVSPHAAEGSGEINIGPVYVEKKVPVLFKHDYATKDYEWSTDEPSYLTDDQESELVEIVEQIVEDSDDEEGDESFDEYGYQGEVSWDTYKDDGRFYDLGAESANPSGGATGDQIISWEHNGLSSPSGPPSDIFWSEDFDAQMGHSRFQKSDNPRRDMSDTRRRLKQEMFSDVSGVFTLKNMAILGLAGITGYLIAGRN